MDLRTWGCEPREPRESSRQVLKRQLWVPPFGAVALIFAADAVAAAKEGRTRTRGIRQIREGLGRSWEKLGDIFGRHMEV